MDIQGYHGYPWISMDIDGYQWISMDIHGYPAGDQKSQGLAAAEKNRSFC